jgi:excisionase family DNA binding protein
MPENDTPRAARYPLLTPSQAAERLGVSTRTMQRMLAEGRMPAVQISSKTYRIRPDVIDELLARAALPATEPAIPYRHVAKRPNTLLPPTRRTRPGARSSLTLSVLHTRPAPS